MTEDRRDALRQSLEAKMKNTAGLYNKDLLDVVMSELNPQEPLLEDKGNIEFLANRIVHELKEYKSTGGIRIGSASPKFLMKEPVKKALDEALKGAQAAIEQEKLDKQNKKKEKLLKDLIGEENHTELFDRPSTKTLKERFEELERKFKTPRNVEAKTTLSAPTRGHGAEEEDELEKRFNALAPDSERAAGYTTEGLEKKFKELEDQFKQSHHAEPESPQPVPKNGNRKKPKDELEDRFKRLAEDYKETTAASNKSYKPKAARKNEKRRAAKTRNRAKE